MKDIERLEKSKFAKHLKTLSNEEIKILFSVMRLSPGTLEAIKMYLTSPNNRIQEVGLDLEIMERKIDITKIKVKT